MKFVYGYYTIKAQEKQANKKNNFKEVKEVMCKKANSDLREYSNAKGVPQYKIAKAFGVVDTTFCKWMREEFSPERKDQYRKIVDKIAESEV